MIKIRVDYSKKFIKKFKRSPIKIQHAFRNRLEIYLKDKYNPILNNHVLAGKYRGLRSINVTDDWRAIFRERGNIVYFVALGTHSQLYR